MTMARCKFLIVPLTILVICQLSYAGNTTYSSYFATILTSDQIAAYKSNGTYSNCTKVVADCDETEGRRIDGTCNNLNYPSIGAARTPYYRILEAEFNRTSSTVFDPRLSTCTGGSLPAARDVRRTLLVDGRVEDTKFTHAATHLAVFYATDITNTQDTSNYVLWRPHCCTAQGASDPQCAANPVPEDDYVHRFTGIRCLNMTRPLTFQTSGCLPNTTTPLRIVDATPLFDLSPVYGNVVDTVRRTYTNGTLKTETVNGAVFPPTTGLNLLLGVNFIGIIFYWRFHNHIAQKLAEINSCWTDEQIFSTARDINIACANQIQYYELMAKLMGATNLINDGVIMDLSLEDTQFRDIYDDTVPPQIALEYPAVLRWMHKMQDGVLKFYDSEGNYLDQSFPMVNLTSNQTFIKQSGHMGYITQGCFRQASGKIDDHVVDSDLLNMGLGGLQRSNDILTNDLAKMRYFGFPSYTKYRTHYFDDDITSFDDLTGIISDEGIEALKEKYSCVEEMDLLAGVWMEELMEDAYVPPTFYSIVKDQLLRNAVCDRHWFESSTRPNAFTEEQMCAIRNITIARILCDIGDTVTEIQPSAFELPGYDNVIVSCDEIVDMDYTAWADSSCSA